MLYYWSLCYLIQLQYVASTCMTHGSHFVPENYAHICDYSSEVSVCSLTNLFHF